MIRVNLLQQKRAKRTDKGQQSILVGFLVVLLAGGGTYFLLHSPLVDAVDAAREANERIQRSINKLKDETKDFDVINRQFQALEAQNASIQRLNDSRAVPAWALGELSSILTKDRQPTMTPEMQERVKSDQNRQWAQAWDPKRVWIDSFAEKGGAFTLRGGAQTDADITQLALRLQASVYFDDVIMQTGSSTRGGPNKVAHFQYTITGRVRY
jgi:type IV pilus assembly protein PilN